MFIETFSIPGQTPGACFEMQFRHYGTPGKGLKVYIQAGLHANEVPGLITALHLRQRLDALDAERRITGEIILVPFANPLGLAQNVLGTHHGRFALADGVNFNRGFPALTEAVAGRIGNLLGDDAAENRKVIARALHAALAERMPERPTDHLKHALLARALDADLVLDLHCDAEALMHLYVLTGQEEVFAPLARLLGAEAVLSARESGDHPFDEAISRPWQELAERFPGRPILPAGATTTVELRGEADVSHEMAAADAEALLGFLALREVLDLPKPALPPARCKATPLAGVDALVAPVSGLVVYAAALGEQIEAGALVAEIVDPLTGAATPVRARTSGTLFTRAGDRFAHAGKRIGKIAGATPFRTGKLLSP